MLERINIINLIKDKKIARMLECENEFVNKFKNNLTPQEQHIFAAKLYCYFNYSQSDFIISLDDVWQWVGFTKKAPAKDLLVNNFTIDTDYKIGDSFMMTLKTFTKFCILARWQVFGNNVRNFYDYYIKLEQAFTKHSDMSENVDVMRKSFSCNNGTGQWDYPGYYCHLENRMLAKIAETSNHIVV